MLKYTTFSNLLTYCIYRPTQPPTWVGWDTSNNLHIVSSVWEPSAAMRLYSARRSVCLCREWMVTLVCYGTILLIQTRNKNVQAWFIRNEASWVHGTAVQCSTDTRGVKNWLITWTKCTVPQNGHTNYITCQPTSRKSLMPLYYKSCQLKQ